MLIVCLYQYCRWRSNYQGEGSLTGLNTPHCRACHKPEQEFSTSHVVFFSCSMFVVLIIDGTVDHQRLISFPSYIENNLHRRGSRYLTPLSTILWKSFNDGSYNGRFSSNIQWLLQIASSLRCQNRMKHGIFSDDH